MITTELAEQLLASSRPTHRFLTPTRLMWIVLGVIIGVSLAAPDLGDRNGVPGWVLPQVALIVLVIVIVRTGAKQRRTSALMLSGFEALQLHQWPEAGDAFARLLRHPIKHPNGRVESLLALATVAEADHQYDAAQCIYEGILAERTASPIQHHTAEVALAAAMLRTGQIADAVDRIDRLGRLDLPGPLQAQVELLTLFREVTMGQAADSIDQAARRRDLFRDHLGTRAGYGYGLLAAGARMAGRTDDARRFWLDATLLVRPLELLERFPELKPVADGCPAAEWPV